MRALQKSRNFRWFSTATLFLHVKILVLLAYPGVILVCSYGPFLRQKTNHLGFFKKTKKLTIWGLSIIAGALPLCCGEMVACWLTLVRERARGQHPWAQHDGCRNWYSTPRRREVAIALHWRIGALRQVVKPNAVTNQSQQLLCEFSPNLFFVPAVSETESGGALRSEMEHLDQNQRVKRSPVSISKLSN